MLFVPSTAKKPATFFQSYSPHVQKAARFPRWGIAMILIGLLIFIFHVAPVMRSIGDASAEPRTAATEEVMGDGLSSVFFGMVFACFFVQIGLWLRVRLVCSNCLNKVANKRVRICPSCRVQLSAPLRK